MDLKHIVLLALAHCTLHAAEPAELSSTIANIEFGAPLLATDLPSVPLDMFPFPTPAANVPALNAATTAAATMAPAPQPAVARPAAPNLDLPPGIRPNPLARPDIVAALPQAQRIAMETVQAIMRALQNG